MEFLIMVCSIFSTLWSTFQTEIILDFTLIFRLKNFGQVADLELNSKVALWFFIFPACRNSIQATLRLSMSPFIQKVHCFFYILTTFSHVRCYLKRLVEELWIFCQQNRFLILVLNSKDIFGLSVEFSRTTFKAEVIWDVASTFWQKNFGVSAN